MNNFTFTENISAPPYNARTYNITKHAVSGGEIFLIIAIFIFLAYWYIRVSKDKEYYTKWKNPNGREINLYKKVRLIFWLYTAIVVILSIIQIIYTNRLVG